MRNTVSIQDLMTSYGRLVYGMCARLCDDPDDASQEVWEKVIRGLERFDPTRSTPARAWIATITRRHLVDRHRRRSVRGEQTSPDELVDPGASPERVVELRTRRHRLEAALEQLPFDQRHVVVMHHIHGVPLNTLADELGVSVGTVKSRLHRGRARLAMSMRSR